MLISESSESEDEGDGKNRKGIKVNRNEAEN